MNRFLTIIFSIFCYFSSCGQKEDPLIIYKCDSINDLVMWVSEYPPILKIKITDLEEILNNGIVLPTQTSDSIMKIFIIAIINCDSSAKYSIPDYSESKRKRNPDLEQKIMELLKANCSWSPGKDRIEFTKTILKRENKKIIYLKQYTHHLVPFGVSLIFEVQNGKIVLKNKINTI